VTALAGPGGFDHVIGIEDVCVPYESRTGRVLDEFAMTQHDRFWSEDLARVADLGATGVRYGFPWHRLNPDRHTYRWDWADRVMDRLAELGLAVLLHFVHPLPPPWLAGGIVDPDYERAVGDYAHRLAERYRGRIASYTAVNEPMVTAFYAGEDGYWPPYLTGQEGLLRIIRGLVRGTVATQEAVTTAEGDGAVFLHSESSFRYLSPAPGRYAAEVEFLRHRAFLVEDLLEGRVDDDHPLRGYLRDNGFSDEDVAWCQEHPAPADVLGVNYYPHLTSAIFDPDQAAGRPRPKRDDWTLGLEENLRDTAARYGRPLLVAETGTDGPVQRRLRWLDDSLALVHRLRAEGMDIRGYTWWPLFGGIDWRWWRSTRPEEDFLATGGLYQLARGPDGTYQRRPTALVERFRQHAGGAVPDQPRPATDR